MRNARGVFGDAAVVGERCNRFSVLKARRAQSKPLGLEDGDTALVKGLSRYSLQQGHGTGSIFSTRAALKCEEGEPVTRLPLSKPYEAPPVRLNDRRTSILSTVLLGRSLRHRYNRHVGAAFGFLSELNLSVYEREQSVIRADSDVAAGMPRGAALARQDVAGHDDLAARFLQAKAPARAIAAVA
jgi:hypothetical protein